MGVGVGMGMSIVTGLVMAMAMETIDGGWELPIPYVYQHQF